MFGVEKYILKQLTKFECVNIIPGEIAFKNDMLMKLINKNKEYEKLILESISLLKGIDKINFNYDKKIIILNYDIYILSENKVLNWIQQVVDVVKENYKEIINNLNKDSKKIISIIKPKLIKRIKDFQ
ncbi:hypothetical protein [Clostridium tarantellae]|uniref:Uncharacterized protein n=1 Tax=Clostridium tarantellae TaxID=39493 RepID=A0A6I1MSA5_9CLOT|nr:hypothetical protein [Clostridium tarantellae]MPQ45072.1 hypothetical protein [Clostridium tarantellae]